MIKATFKNGKFEIYTGSRKDITHCVKYKYVYTSGNERTYYTWSKSAKNAKSTARANITMWVGRNDKKHPSYNTIEVVSVVDTDA